MVGGRQTFNHQNRHLKTLHYLHLPTDVCRTDLKKSFFKKKLKCSEEFLSSKYEICMQRFLSFGLLFFPPEQSILRPLLNFQRCISGTNSDNLLDAECHWLGCYFCCFSRKRHRSRTKREMRAERGNCWESLPVSTGTPAALPQHLL